MTAIPAVESMGVQLICDGCGGVAITDGCGLHDADVVYVAVAAIGWSGSAFARGPHRCPRCSSPAVTPPRCKHRGPATAAVSDRVHVEHNWAAAVVRVVGEIDMDIAPELRSAHPNVIVDLSKAGSIDSTALGTLVRARNAARRRQCELLLAGPSRFVQTVLRTMRLHTAFRTFGTLQQALTAAHGSGCSSVIRARAHVTER